MQPQMPIPPVPVRRTADNNDRPLRALVKETWEETGKLFRQELQLAITELDTRAQRAKTEVIGASIAGVVLLGGMLAILAALILLLSLAMAPWVAALIVGAATSVVGFALFAKAKTGLETEKMKPERTVRSVKRDVQMLKEAVK